MKIISVVIVSLGVGLAGCSFQERETISPSPKIARVSAQPDVNKPVFKPKAPPLIAAAAPATEELLAEHDFAVDHGDYADVPNPPCGDPRFEAPGPLATAVASGALQFQAGVSSTPVGLIGQLLVSTISRDMQGRPGAIAHLIAPNRYSYCAVVVDKLPDGVTGLRYEYYQARVWGRWIRASAVDQNGFSNGPEEIGWSAWKSWVDKGTSFTLIKNWSSNRAYFCKVKIYGVVPRKTA